MHTFLYARVSTTDQTIAHQRAQAEAAGYVFDEVIEDPGVSGVTTRFKDRKGGALLLGKLRRGDVRVVRWVDRLGRSYDDVTETIRTLMQRGVVIKTIINGMVFDGATKDPIQMAVRDALIEGILHDTARIAQGAILPALGEPPACDYCAARGLCRRDSWTEVANV